MARGRCKPCKKKIYAPLDQAVHAALWSSMTFGRAMRYYACPAGNGWHLTTQPDRPVVK